MNAGTTKSRTLLVTGAGGFVAGSVLLQAGGGWKVHALSRRDPLSRRDNLCWHGCDLASTKDLTRMFGEIRPDVTIHTAALADIDRCEQQRELARAINVEVTRVLARLCADANRKLIFCSTDTVFDGEHAPYRENDPPGPVNFYAETKVEAERFVTSLGVNGVVARLSLVVGLPLLGAGNSFLPRLLTALKEGREVAAPTQEIRTPVDVITAGRALLELAAGEHHGIFHLAGRERLSRFAMAQRIAEQFGLPARLVVPQSLASLVGRAPRPRDVSLDIAMTSAKLKTPMRMFDEALSLVQQSAAALPT